MFVYCECYVLSDRGLCDKLITNPEEYWLWCVVVWSRNLVNEEALGQWGLSRQKQTNKQTLERDTLGYFPWLTLITKNESCTYIVGIGGLVEIAVQQWFDGVPQQVHEGAVVVICLWESHNAVQGVLEHDGGSLLPRVHVTQAEHMYLPVLDA